MTSQSDTAILTEHCVRFGPSHVLTGAVMSDPLLTIRNHHTPMCGDPPIVNGEDSGTYIGYFENRYGEQWVFTRDRTTGEATLRGGDIGWNTVHPVVDGTVEGLILNREERAWLEACWAAAAG